MHYGVREGGGGGEREREEGKIIKAKTEKLTAPMTRRTHKQQQQNQLGTEKLRFINVIFFELIKRQFWVDDK